MKSTPVVLFVCSLILAGCITTAPSVKNWQTVDTRTRVISPDTQQNPDSLAVALTAGLTSDQEKARAIFFWITQNIRFDEQEFNSDQYTKKTAAEILQRKKGICDDYAVLFRDLARAAGMEAEFIPGYSKWDQNSRPGQGDEPSHAWNAVKINGQWKLLDCTWGSGYYDSDKNKFIRKARNHYFLTDPGVFAGEHLPVDPAWQLLETPVTLEQFNELVYMKPALVEYGIGVLKNTKRLLETGDNVDLELDVPRNILIDADLLKDGQAYNVPYYFISRYRGQCNVLVNFPEAGEYVLRLFAAPIARGVEEYEYKWILEYTVRASKGKGEDAYYPILYDGFKERLGYLAAPFSGYLKPGTMTQFDIQIPGAEEVRIVQEVLGARESARLARDPERNSPRFSGRFNIVGAPVYLEAVFGKVNPYQDRLIGFPVRE